MESDRDSLVMGSSAVTPWSGEPAALEAGSAGKPEAGAAADQAVLERLLAMAHRYRSEGNLRQAMELYWTLAEDYPGTPQADVARVGLLELAAGYERNEARHMARSIYERLLEGEYSGPQKLDNKRPSRLRSVTRGGQHGDQEESH